MISQNTLGHPVRATGFGVHSGEPVLMSLYPAPADSGIVFRRIDLATPVDIKASNTKVDPAVAMSTALCEGTVRVGTTEHLLSAFAGMGIDNAIVELDAPELPIMDGSSAAFVFLIRSAGTVAQKCSPKRFIRILKEVRVEHKGSWASLKPCNGFRLSYQMDYAHPDPAFSELNSAAQIDFSKSSYYSAVSRARTFGFLADYERVKAMGYAAGSNLSNSIVFDDFRLLNEAGLRYSNECARHKILDAVGDLLLIGAPMLGEFSGYKSGHALNHMLSNALLADEKAWEFVTFEDEQSGAGIAFPTWLQHDTLAGLAAD